MGSRDDLRDLLPAPAREAGAAAAGGSAGGGGGGGGGSGGRAAGTRAVKKSTQACDRCRTKRVKCDGALPQCTACERALADCSYHGGNGRRRKDRLNENRQLRERIQDLEASLTVTPSYIDRAELRPSVQSPVSSQGSGRSGISSHSLLPGGYDIKNMPPADLLQRALDAFKNHLSKFLYVVSHARIDYLAGFVRGETVLDAGGVGEQGPSEQGGLPGHHLALSELCAVAAAGCNFSNSEDEFPEEFRETLFRTATVRLWEFADGDADLALRIFVCIAITSMFEKRLGRARMFVAAALEMSREQTNRAAASDDQEDNSEGPYGRSRFEWRGLYRTIMIVDGLLVFVSGTGRVQATEVDRVELSRVFAYNSFEDSIQLQIGSISNLVSQGLSFVLQTRNSGNASVNATAEYHLERLRQWRSELPPQMLLSAPLVSEVTTDRRHLIYVIHLLYLGGLIALHLPKILVSVDDLDYLSFRTTNPAPLIGSKFTEVLSAVDSMVRLLRLMSENGFIGYLGAVAIYDLYMSGVIVIYKCWMEFMSKSIDALETSLVQLVDVIDLLRSRGQQDHVAMAYSRRLQPEQDAVADAFRIARASSATLQTPLGALPAEDPTLDADPAQDERLTPAGIRDRLRFLVLDVAGPQMTLRLRAADTGLATDVTEVLWT